MTRQQTVSQDGFETVAGVQGRWSVFHREWTGEVQVSDFVSRESWTVSEAEWATMPHTDTEFQRRVRQVRQARRQSRQQFWSSVGGRPQ